MHSHFGTSAKLSVSKIIQKAREASSLMFETSLSFQLVVKIVFFFFSGNSSIEIEHIRFTRWFSTFMFLRIKKLLSRAYSFLLKQWKKQAPNSLVFSLCFTLLTLQYAIIIFHTKRRESCCYIGSATEIENTLRSGLFIFNSFSSVLFASSKIPLHSSKLLKEAISMLLVWPIPSMHETATKPSEETFLLHSHHLLNCSVDNFSALMSYLPIFFAL